MNSAVSLAENLEKQSVISSGKSVQTHVVLVVDGSSLGGVQVHGEKGVVCGAFVVLERMELGAGLGGSCHDDVINELVIASMDNWTIIFLGRDLEDNIWKIATLPHSSDENLLNFIFCGRKNRKTHRFDKSGEMILEVKMTCSVRCNFLATERPQVDTRVFSVEMKIGAPRICHLEGGDRGPGHKVFAFPGLVVVSHLPRVVG
jgi:hypothetical protein